MRRLEMDTMMNSRAPTPLFCLATTPTKCTAYRYAPGHHMLLPLLVPNEHSSLVLTLRDCDGPPAQTGVYVVNVTDGTHKCTSLRCSAGTTTPH